MGFLSSVPVDLTLFLLSTLLRVWFVEGVVGVATLGLLTSPPRKTSHFPFALYSICIKLDLKDHFLDGMAGVPPQGPGSPLEGPNH